MSRTTNEPGSTCARTASCSSPRPPGLVIKLRSRPMPLRSTKNYVIILALIPAVASSIGLSVVGLGAVRRQLPAMPIIAGLAPTWSWATCRLVAGDGVRARIAHHRYAMAPTFKKAPRARPARLKLSAYTSTAGFVSGITVSTAAFAVERTGRGGGALRHLPALPGPAGADEVPARQGRQAPAAVVVICTIVGGFVVLPGCWHCFTPSPARASGMGHWHGFRGQAVAARTTARQPQDA